MYVGLCCELCAFTGLVNGSCRGSTDDIYGCLTLTITTSTNDTLMACPILPGRLTNTGIIATMLSSRLLSHYFTFSLKPAVVNASLVLQHAR